MNHRTLIQRIEQACVASCSCVTKTPDWEAHEEDCRYRVLHEAAFRLREYDHSFDLRWKADMLATKRWHAATGRELTWPAHTDLVVWLLEQLEAAEAPKP